MPFDSAPQKPRLRTPAIDATMSAAIARLTIMLVDDQRTIRKILSQTFRHYGITSVLEAENGADALKQLTRPDRPRPDLIITDINMSVMDGLELLQRIRLDKDHGLRGIPVLVLSGERDETILAIAAEMGSAAVLPKPVSAADLVTAAGRALGFDIGKSAAC